MAIMLGSALRGEEKAIMASKDVAATIGKGDTEEEAVAKEAAAGLKERIEEEEDAGTTLLRDLAPAIIEGEEATAGTIAGGIERATPIGAEKEGATPPGAGETSPLAGTDPPGGTKFREGKSLLAPAIDVLWITVNSLLGFFHCLDNSAI